MGLAATGVDVAVIADIPAGNLQSVLGAIYGKAQYAADAVGSAIYKADQANGRIDAMEGTLSYATSAAGEALYKADALAPRVDSLEGSVAYATGIAGFLDYHLRQIAGLVSYTVPAYGA